MSSYGAALVDLQRDGTVDVFVAGHHGGNRLWLNDGSGRFTLGSPGFGTENAADVALGDVDGDGDVDALVANAMGKPNRLWLNRGSGGPLQERLAPPIGLTATAISESSIGLAWTDQAVDETSYRVERSVDGATGWEEIATLPANSGSYVDTPIGCGDAYYYRVRAYRASGGLYSAYSHLARVQTPACAPLAAPSGLMTTAVSQSQIDLAWVESSADETSLRVERSPDGSIGWTEIAVLEANATAYSDRSLDCGTGYAYRVRAYREADEQFSPYSNVSSAVTNLCPLPAPSGLSARAVSQNQIELSWTDNDADESAYLVERSPDGVNAWMVVVTVGANETCYQDTELSCAMPYYYRVRAYRAADGVFSSYSEVEKAVTWRCKDTPSYHTYLPMISNGLP